MPPRQSGVLTPARWGGQPPPHPGNSPLNSTVNMLRLRILVPSSKSSILLSPIKQHPLMVPLPLIPSHPNMTLQPRHLPRLPLLMHCMQPKLPSTTRKWKSTIATTSPTMVFPPLPPPPPRHLQCLQPRHLLLLRTMRKRNNQCMCSPHMQRARRLRWSLVRLVFAATHNFIFPNIGSLGGQKYSRSIEHRTSFSGFAHSANE